MKRLCSHFGNCRAQKTHETGVASMRRSAEGTKRETESGRLCDRETTMPIERSLDSGVTGPPGNYDNYRNSWGAIRPAKRQKRTRARFATRRVDFLPLPRCSLSSPVVKINVVILITVDDVAPRKIACSVIFPIARKSKDHFGHICSETRSAFCSPCIRRYRC